MDEARLSAWTKWICEFWADHPWLDLVFVSATATGAVALWFRNAGLAFGSDLTLPFYPGTRLTRFLYAYNAWLGTGSQNPALYGAPDLVETVGFFLFQPLGGIQPAQLAFLAAVYAVGAMSVYFLTRCMITGEAYARVSGYAAAVFFLFNPFLFGDNYTQIVATSVPRAALPLFLALLLQGLQSGRMRYAPALGATSFLVAITFPIEQYAVFAGGLGVLMVVAYLFAPPRSLSAVHRLRSRLKFLCASIGLIAASNVYILWYAASLFGLLAAPYQGFAPNLEVGTSLTLDNSIRLFGAWPFFSDYLGVPYVPYSAAYLQSAVLAALGFVIPILAFGAVLLRPHRYSVRLMTLVALGTVFLAKNYNPPFGGAFGFLVNSVPGFKLFYGGWPFIDLAAIEYATLVGVSVGALAERAARSGPTANPRTPVPRRFQGGTYAALTVFLLTAVLLSVSWPLVTGDVSVNWIQPGQRGITVPSEYPSLNEWLQSSDPAGRVFVMPALGTYFATSWGYQGTSAFYQTVLENPVVQTTSGEYNIGRDESAAVIQSAYQAATQLVIRQPQTPVWNAGSPAPTWSLAQTPSPITDSLGNASGSGNPVLLWTIRDEVAGQAHSLSLPWSGSIASLQVIVLNLSQPIVPDPPASRLLFGVWDANQSLGKYLFTNAQIVSGISSVTGLFKIAVPDDGGFDPARVASFSFTYVGTGDGSTWQLRLQSLGVAAAAPDAERLSSLLGMLGVRHVLLDMSTATSLYPGTDLATPEMALSQTTSFALERTQGFLRLYNLNRAQPEFGVATHLLFYNTTSQVPDLAEPLSATAGAIAVNMSQLSPEALASLKDFGTGLPEFSANTQGPTVFDAVYNSSNPFALTLNFGYSDSWVVQVDGKTVPLFHVVVNGYANGWIVTETGKHSIRLTYDRQLGYSVAVGATVATLIVEGSLVPFLVLSRKISWVRRKVN